MKKQFESFAAFYPFYLSQHRHPMTRALHVAGLILVFSSLTFAVAARQGWFLALVPILGYGPAWFGHFFFEKNRPATFQYPFYSLLGDFVMFKDTVLRKKLFLLAVLAGVGWHVGLLAQETETAPLEVSEAEVRYTITNGGIDSETKGIYAIYPVDNRTRQIGYANSGYVARIPSGTYDVAFRYRDGTIKKEIWLKKQLLEGIVDQTVEMNVVSADVILHVNRLGQPVTTADCALYATGQKTDPIARLVPEEVTKVSEGLYDTACTYKDQDLSVEQWQLNQTIVSKKDITFNFDFKKATFRIVDPPSAAPPVSSLVQLFASGNREKAAARGVIGSSLALPAGTYDVLIQRDQKTATWLGVTIEGDVSVPFTETPPATVMKNLTIAPETSPAPETAPETIHAPETTPAVAETKPQTQPVPTQQTPPPPSTGPQGLPLAPNLTPVPSAPMNWHGWFGCALIR